MTYLEQQTNGETILLGIQPKNVKFGEFQMLMKLQKPISRLTEKALSVMQNSKAIRHTWFTPSTQTEPILKK